MTLAKVAGKDTMESIRAEFDPERTYTFFMESRWTDRAGVKCIVDEQGQLLPDPSKRMPWDKGQIGAFDSAACDVAELLLKGSRVLCVCRGGKNRSALLAHVAVQRALLRQGGLAEELRAALQETVEHLKIHLPADEVLRGAIGALVSNKLERLPAEGSRPKRARR